ncbi:hypothetical protein QBC44DRAFT_336950 [Cladorrhinum sp. PSN332]|nr:hypothetical protein QBC44DRAFT_336950 [Cladorrhinum sp. PSN332]
MWCFNFTSDSHQWTELGKEPSAATNALVLRVFSVFDEVLMEWEFFLSEIDSSLDVELISVLSHQRRTSIMYDDAKLNLSECYFVSSEMLRFASDWTQGGLLELSHTLCAIKDHFEPWNSDRKSYRSHYQKQCLHFDTIRLYFKGECDSLLANIDKQQKKVERLRNTLFTPTAVHEASNSKQLNHCILVFTVVTVIYLPLSFVNSVSFPSQASQSEESRKTK